MKFAKSNWAVRLHYDVPLSQGILIKRYKRFLADVVLPDGSQTTIHCPNTGSMLGCALEGSSVWFSAAQNTQRRYPFTWELVEPAAGVLVGINTHRSNNLAREAIEKGVACELQGYSTLTPEVKFGAENSRIDFLLTKDNKEQCYIEVKTVTLGMESGQGFFPDAVTTRGSKHLRELMHMKKLGHRAVLFFCVQHTGVTHVSPADHIDSVYGELLRQAVNEGVEVIAYGAEISSKAITLVKPLPVVV